MSSTIFVTGVTGNQGSEVARSLLTKGFHVKGLTRDVNTQKALRMQALGVELVKGDLKDPGSYESHIKDVAGVFSVQQFGVGIKNEMKWGISVADLAKKHGAGHLVYTSVASADQGTGIPHFESKHLIEQHIKQLNLSYTILRPVSLMENLLMPEVKSRILKGKLSSPVNKNVPQQFVSSRDVGNISSLIFQNPLHYTGKTIDLASEQMDMEKMAALFTELLGKKVSYQKLPMFITRLLMGKDLHTMFKWINTNTGILARDQHAAVKEYEEESMRDWIQRNFNN